MAFVNLSQGKLLNMLRSAALLSPIAHMNQLASPTTKLAAQFFLANVSHVKNDKLIFMHVNIRSNFIFHRNNTYENINFSAHTTGRVLVRSPRIHSSYVRE